MTTARRAALAVACVLLFAMPGMGCPAAAARTVDDDPPRQTTAKPRLAGRPVIDVLREFQSQGIRLIYSSDLVSPTLRVMSEPRGRNPRAIIADVLAPHGLTVRDGPRN